MRKSALNFSFKFHFTTLIAKAHSNAHGTLTGQQIERSKVPAAIFVLICEAPFIITKTLRTADLISQIHRNICESQDSSQTSKNPATERFKSLKRVDFHLRKTLRTQSIHDDVRDDRQLTKS